MSGPLSLSWRNACCYSCSCWSPSPMSFMPTARSGRRCRCGAPHLHRRPDLAVGINDIGDGDQQEHEQQQAFRQDNDKGPDIGEEKFGHVHGRYSAAVLVAALARAEHSAMVAEARAIGLVR